MVVRVNPRPARVARLVLLGVTTTNVLASSKSLVITDLRCDASVKAQWCILPFQICLASSGDGCLYPWIRLVGANIAILHEPVDHLHRNPDILEETFLFASSYRSLCSSLCPESRRFGLMEGMASHLRGGRLADTTAS